MVNILRPNATIATAIKALWNSFSPTDIRTIQADLAANKTTTVMNLLIPKVSSLNATDQQLLSDYFSILTSAC